MGVTGGPKQTPVCARIIIDMRTIFLALLILLTPLSLHAAPASKPSTRPSTAPSPRPHLTPEQQNRLKVMQLTRQSLEFFKQKKYDKVEEVLTEALVLDPDNATNIYNMACVKSVTGKLETAMTYLERAADAGFTDFLHIQSDSDLEPLRTLPRYKALIAARDQYQKKDADRAVESLRKQLGDNYLFDLDPVHKLIFAADTDKETLAAVKKWLSAQAKSQHQQLFDHLPEQYVAIVLPSLVDYRNIIKQPGVEGIYMPATRMLIARRLGQVMTHEFTHAMHAGDLEPLGQEHPIWIVEGLASLFEAGVFEGEKLVPRDNYRLWFLQAAYRQKKLIPLDKLITWKQPQFVSNANLGYGQASSVMMYLYDKGLLKKFYDTYKRDFDKDPSGKTTLEKVTGKAIAQFDKEWQAWMVKRTPPAYNTGPDGPFLGVQFAQENDGLKIEMVIPNGPAAQAGIKVADVIVGFNALDIRDQTSLMPLLKEFKPGDKVVFKLRRGEEYLDLPLVLGRRDNKPAPTTRPAATTRASAPAKKS